MGHSFYGTLILVFTVLVLYKYSNMVSQSIQKREMIGRLTKHHSPIGAWSQHYFITGDDVGVSRRIVKNKCHEVISASGRKAKKKDT